MKIIFQICFTMSESDFESDSELSSSDDESEEDNLSSTSDEEEMVESKEAEVNIIKDEDIDVNNITEQESPTTKAGTFKKPDDAVNKPTSKTWNMWDNKRLYSPSSKCKIKAWRFKGFLKDT